MLEQLHNEFPEDVQVVFRHFPLIGTPEQPFHDKAAISARAAEAAGKQDRFWEMHDLLFEHQSEWSNLTESDFRTWLEDQIGSLSIDRDKFFEDLDSDTLQFIVQQAWDWGIQIGMPGTPFVLINGKVWDFNIPLSRYNLSAVVKLTLLEQRQFSSCPPMSIDPEKRYIATLQTEKGDIVVELFPDKAPLAVNSFIFLAKSGWFDNITFHRVIKDYIAQAGDPTGTGFGGPGYAFENEILADLVFDRAGLVAMANAGEGSNGSQFFITYAPVEELNGKYTIFGQVISGMEITESLTERDPSQNADIPAGDVLISVTIEEK